MASGDPLGTVTSFLGVVFSPSALALPVLIAQALASFGKRRSALRGILLAFHWWALTAVILAVCAIAPLPGFVLRLAWTLGPFALCTGLAAAVVAFAIARRPRRRARRVEALPVVHDEALGYRKAETRVVERSRPMTISFTVRAARRTIRRGDTSILGWMAILAIGWLAFAAAFLPGRGVPGAWCSSRSLVNDLVEHVRSATLQRRGANACEAISAVAPTLVTERCDADRGDLAAGNRLVVLGRELGCALPKTHLVRGIEGYSPHRICIEALCIGSRSGADDETCTPASGTLPF